MKARKRSPPHLCGQRYTFPPAGSPALHCSTNSRRLRSLRTKLALQPVQTRCYLPVSLEIDAVIMRTGSLLQPRASPRPASRAASPREIKTEAYGLADCLQAAEKRRGAAWRLKAGYFAPGQIDNRRPALKALPVRGSAIYGESAADYYGLQICDCHADIG